MALNKKFYDKVIKKPDTIIQAKRYEYMAKDCGKYYAVYRRRTEMDKWKKFLFIKKSDGLSMEIDSKYCRRYMENV